MIALANLGKRHCVFLKSGAVEGNKDISRVVPYSGAFSHSSSFWYTLNACVGFYYWTNQIVRQFGSYPVCGFSLLVQSIVKTSKRAFVRCAAEGNTVVRVYGAEFADLHMG